MYFANCSDWQWSPPPPPPEEVLDTFRDVFESWFGHSDERSNQDIFPLDCHDAIHHLFAPIYSPWLMAN
jgi:hypothetical protein